MLAGLVERVTYHNVENGFCVLRAKARGHRDVVPLSAKPQPLQPVSGSRRQANGYRIHGQQFKARFLRTSLPEFSRRHREVPLVRYDPGVGPVYAKKLLRTFGEKVFDVIEATADRLREVNGIGPVRAAG